MQITKLSGSPEIMLPAALATLNDKWGDIAQFADGINVKSGRSARVRLRTKTGKIPGARNSWSGRSGPYACWHLQRDFYYAIFASNPNAVIHTALARYTKDNFETTYPDTYWHNAGSMVDWKPFGDLCYDCGSGA